MHTDDIRPDRRLSHAGAIPRHWAQPTQVDEPILDAARVPLSTYFAKNGPRWTKLRKLTMYAWLRVVRPLFTAAVWAEGLIYTSRLMLGTPEPNTQRLLWVYASIISIIFVGMLIMAPFRRDQHRSTASFKSDESSLMALAEYISVPPAELSLHQKAKRLLVQHNTHGRLHSALSTPLSRPLGPQLALEAL